MTWKHLHREEAQSTDHDADVQDLRSVAPPCRDCGSEPAAPDSEFCPDCRPAAESGGGR
ncbi:hypothetical protein ACOZ4F_20140 (plasmid) [Haloarcula marismortui]|uniref:hypothetical protein n=1 Tax=Haloarcula marismortui TaxID=2238 RepID=UPI003C737221